MFRFNQVHCKNLYSTPCIFGASLCFIEKVDPEHRSARSELQGVGRILRPGGGWGGDKNGVPGGVIFFLARVGIVDSSGQIWQIF